MKLYTTRKVISQASDTYAQIFGGELFYATLNLWRMCHKSGRVRILVPGKAPDPCQTMAEENGEVKMAAVRHCSIKSEGSGGKAWEKPTQQGTLAWILWQTPPLFMCLFLNLL